MFRMKNWKNEKPNGHHQNLLADRGYVSMYIKHVTGADKGADLDFLKGKFRFSSNKRLTLRSGKSYVIISRVTILGEIFLYEKTH